MLYKFFIVISIFHYSFVGIESIFFQCERYTQHEFSTATSCKWIIIFTMLYNDQHLCISKILSSSHTETLKPVSNNCLFNPLSHARSLLFCSLYEFAILDTLYKGNHRVSSFCVCFISFTILFIHVVAYIQMPSFFRLNNTVLTTTICLHIRLMDLGCLLWIMLLLLND